MEFLEQEGFFYVLERKSFPFAEGYFAAKATLAFDWSVVDGLDRMPYAWKTRGGLFDRCARVRAYVKTPRRSPRLTEGGRFCRVLVLHSCGRGGCISLFWRVTEIGRSFPAVSCCLAFTVQFDQC